MRYNERKEQKGGFPMKRYTVEKRKIPSTGRDIKILIFRPTVAKKDVAHTAGVLWIHGGGYAVGMAEMAYFSRPLALVKKYGAVVVCLDYRLSTEAPYPAALEDCYSALLWMQEFDWKTLLTYWASGFPMDCIHAAGTWFFLWVAARPMLEKLERIETKYGPSA